MKMRLAIFLVALLVVTACARDFAPLREEKKYGGDYQDVKKTELQEEVMINKMIVGEQYERVQAEAQQEIKLTEAECRKSWKPLMDLRTPLLVLEKRYIIAIFRSDVSFQKAKDLLEEHDAKFEKTVEIIPLGNEVSDESRYNAYRRIKARVAEGREIKIACRLLQEQEIENASPSTIVDFQSLVKAARQ
ncbi:MAG TPA: hypothetical protein VJH37_00540 [Candidatus Nanoarchaeia archaeon]|nr:hypothetical protein [Candidatus Nanoarchaeia archaeon]